MGGSPPLRLDGFVGIQSLFGAQLRDEPMGNETKSAPKALQAGIFVDADVPSGIRHLGILMTDALVDSAARHSREGERGVR